MTYGASCQTLIISQVEILQRVGSRRSAGAVVQELADAKPDAIFSSLFAADLHKFVAA